MARDIPQRFAASHVPDRNVAVRVARDYGSAVGTEDQTIGFGLSVHGTPQPAATDVPQRDLIPLRAREDSAIGAKGQTMELF